MVLGRVFVSSAAAEDLANPICTLVEVAECTLSLDMLYLREQANSSAHARGSTFLCCIACVETHKAKRTAQASISTGITKV